MILSAIQNGGVNNAHFSSIYRKGPKNPLIYQSGRRQIRDFTAPAMRTLRGEQIVRRATFNQANVAKATHQEKFTGGYNTRVEQANTSMLEGITHWASTRLLSFAFVATDKTRGCIPGEFYKFAPNGLAKHGYNLRNLSEQIRLAQVITQQGLEKNERTTSLKGSQHTIVPLFLPSAQSPENNRKLTLQNFLGFRAPTPEEQDTLLTQQLKTAKLLPLLRSDVLPSRKKGEVSELFDTCPLSGTIAFRLEGKDTLHYLPLEAFLDTYPKYRATGSAETKAA